MWGEGAFNRWRKWLPRRPRKVMQSTGSIDAGVAFDAGVSVNTVWAVVSSYSAGLNEAAA